MRYVTIHGFTGSYAQTYAETHSIPFTATGMLGDVNDDGLISITDYTLVRLDILGLKELEQTARIASDINGDGKISITDYTLIRLNILGLKSIH